MASNKAPGVKIVKNLSLKTKWIIFLSLGIIFLCLGLVFLIHSSHVRQIANSGFRWILLSAYGLALMIAGLLSYAYAMALRAKIEAKKILKKVDSSTSRKKLSITKLKSPIEKFDEASESED